MNELRYKTIFDDVTLSAGSSTTSSLIDLGTKYPDGFFSLQIDVAGSGTMKFEYLLSNTGVDYIDPTDADDIVSSFTETSGKGSDGKDFYSFTPGVSRFMKLKATETGGSSSADVTGVLVYQ